MILLLQTVLLILTDQILFRSSLPHLPPDTIILHAHKPPTFSN